MPGSVNSVGYIKCYSSCNPKPIESPSNAIRYAVDREDVKPEWKYQKKGHISLGDQELY